MRGLVDRVPRFVVRDRHLLAMRRARPDCQRGGMSMPEEFEEIEEEEEEEEEEDDEEDEYDNDDDG
jgi:hypothetical protein